MNNQVQKMIDEKSRYLILNNTDENYFVEAGAGSGKTTTLVGRMVKMIEEGKRIEHISAITFTKAAANEFYDRFQKKLIEKSLENNEYKDKYLGALQNIDLAFMGTIDSFCNMLMSEHPNEGLIPSNAKIIDDNKARELYEREYANIQNGKYNNTILEEKAKLFIKYDSFAKNSFVEIMQKILNHRDCELVIPKLEIENIDEKFKDEISTIRKIVGVLCKHPDYIKSSNDDNETRLRQAINNYKYIFDNPWDSNTPNITKAFKNTFLYKLNKKNTSLFRLYFSTEVEDLLKEGIHYFVPNKKKWYDINYEKFSVVLKYIEKVKYVTSLDFVNCAKDVVLDVLRKEGKLTFNDYLIYLRDTLRKDAKGDGKLIRHIYDRHRYFLIDEFQDTDPIQAEIFFYLAAEEIKENWKDCIPHKGSLFIVGDPKQSIYRFKNADVTSYLKVEEMFDDVNVDNPKIGSVLYLYSNFRSTVELREWFNLTFKELLPIRTENQAPYEDIPISDDDVYRGEFSGVYRYDVSSDDKDEEKVAKILLKIHDNENFKIVGKKKEDTRKIEWKDIMIITPSKLSLSRYTRVLREKNIPYFVEGNIDFKQSEAFVCFVDYFGSVINPNDNRYLYKILKSKIYGINEAELVDARKKGYELNLLVDPNNFDISQKLIDVLNELRSFVLDAKRLSSSSLFIKIVENVKAFKVFGNENMEYVYFALELIKNKEINKEIISHKDSLKFFNDLLSPENKEERCPGLQASNNQVHLANLHKVKGLEAPIVLLASPRGRDREPEFRMIRNENGNVGYLFNVKKSTNNGKYKIINTDLFDDPYKNDEQESSDAESLRLEYVAATRAKNVLIISNYETKNGPSETNPWIEMLKCASSEKLNDIEVLLEKYEEEDIGKDPIDYETYENSNNILVAKNEILKTTTYKLNNPSKLHESSTFVEVETSLKHQKNIDENNGDSLSTITGTIVHRLLELIVMSKDLLDKQKMIDFIVDENVTSEFVDRKQYFINLLNDIYEIIHSGGYKQKGKAPQDILPILLTSDKCYCEVPFTYKDGDNLWNGIIDLIYEKDDKLHIIDWKTNKNDDNLDEHYHNQLEAYKKAVKQVLDKDVEDALIYHINVASF